MDGQYNKCPLNVRSAVKRIIQFLLQLNVDIVDFALIAMYLDSGEETPVKNLVDIVMVI